MTRKIVLFSFAALAVVAVALSARAKNATPAVLAANNPAPSAVTLAPVKAVKSAPREEITGALQPAKALQVGFEVPGRLARILVKKGQLVQEGQIIAQLDPELSDAQVLQAEAGLKAAEAQASIANDSASRQSELQKSGSVSDFQSKSTSSQAAAANAGVQAAKAALAQARAARRRHDLKAPFAGVLIESPDQIGATVAPGMTLFTLEQLDPLVLKLTVSDTARAVLRIGTRVHVEAVSGGQSTEDAWVRAVIPSADPATRRIPVELVVPNKDARFTAHTLARAVLPMGSQEDALSLPASALSSSGGDHVYVMAGGEVKRIAVQVLDRGAQQVVVKSREAFDKVVDYPAADLQDGAKVSVK